MQIESVDELEQLAGRVWPNARDFFKVKVYPEHELLRGISLLGYFHGRFAADVNNDPLYLRSIQVLDILENPFTAPEKNDNPEISARYPLACQYFRLETIALLDNRVFLSFLRGNLAISLDAEPITSNPVFENANRLEEYLRSRLRPGWHSAMRQLPLPISQAILEYM